MEVDKARNSHTNTTKASIYTFYTLSVCPGMDMFIFELPAALRWIWLKCK